MMIRYMNARGEEATLADARALAFKVQMGEIDARTLMFDEGVGAWVPAAGHPAFQCHMGSPGGDASPEAALPALPEASVGPPVSPPSAQLPAEESLMHSWAPMPSPHVSPPAGGAASGIGGGGSSAGTTEVEGSSPEQAVATPPSGPESSLPPVPEYPAITPRSAFGRSQQKRFALLACLFVVGGAGAVIVLNPSWGVAGWISTLIRGDLGDVQVGELVAAPVTPSPRALAAAERVAQAVVTDLAREFTRVPDELGLPDEPPKAWLGGRYLSGASQYSDVLDYWDSFRAVVQLLRAREAATIHTSFDRHLSGLQAAEGPRFVVEKLALTSLDEGATRRASVYAVAEDLAATATDLHAFLLRWEGRIQYEPATGSGASRAPVIEAVAEGEVLRVEFAAALDRVLGALDVANGLEPVLTRNFFDRLSERIQKTLEPIDPDTVVQAVSQIRAGTAAGVGVTGALQ